MTTNNQLCLFFYLHWDPGLKQTCFLWSHEDSGWRVSRPSPPQGQNPSLGIATGLALSSGSLPTILSPCGQKTLSALMSWVGAHTEVQTACCLSNLPAALFSPVFIPIFHLDLWISLAFLGAQPHIYRDVCCILS